MTAAASFVACAHLDAEAARKSLLQADADFARDVAARGTEAWVEAFAEDGAMLIANAPLIRGREKIRELMAELGDPHKGKPELLIRWRPLGAQVSNDGDARVDVRKLGFGDGPGRAPEQVPDGVAQAGGRIVEGAGRSGIAGLGGSLYSALIRSKPPARAGGR
jgi:hypothetical protein